jgi:hypothetical protein
MEKGRPQTAEDVLKLQHAGRVGWTSDSQEAFLAPYQLNEDDLAGLSEAAARSNDIHERSADQDNHA